MKHHQSIELKKPPVMLRMYVMGFVASVELTLMAYMFVTHSPFSRLTIVAAIAVLALLQCFVQLVFFLHLGQETRPRWKLLTLGGMLLTVLILVLGSIWIMNNLSYRMSPVEMNTYMLDQDGL